MAFCTQWSIICTCVKVYIYIYKSVHTSKLFLVQSMHMTHTHTQFVQSHAKRCFFSHLLMSEHRSKSFQMLAACVCVCAHEPHTHTPTRHTHRPPPTHTWVHPYRKFTFEGHSALGGRWCCDSLIRCLVGGASGWEGLLGDWSTQRNDHWGGGGEDDNDLGLENLYKQEVI